MKNRWLALAPIALVLAPAVTCPAELSQKGETMMDAMIGAMDAMGLVERGRQARSAADQTGGWSSMMPSGSSGMPSMPGMSPMPGMPSMPGMSPMPGMPSMPGMSTMPGMPSMPGTSSFGGVPNPMGSPWSSMPSWPGASTNPWQAMGSAPWGSMPWPGAGGMPKSPADWGAMGWPMPSKSGPGEPRDRAGGRTDFLDGTWEGSGGELLMIRNGMFRVYESPDSYRDGYLSMDRGQLLLRDEDSGQTHRYEMRFRADQLALRDSDGQVLEFKRSEEGGAGH